MKRDMDLIRNILLEIEEKHNGYAIRDFKIDGYDLLTLAYHCKILYEAGLISAYNSENGDNRINRIAVGGLTWDGCDFIEKIREDYIWNQTKETINKKKLPFVLETIKSIATTIIASVSEGVTTAIIKNNCQA